MTFVALLVLAALCIAGAFLAGDAHGRSRREDAMVADTEKLPPRIGRPEFTGYATPPSRYVTAPQHPPEPEQPPAP